MAALALNLCAAEAWIGRQWEIVRRLDAMPLVQARAMFDLPPLEQPEGAEIPPGWHWFWPDVAIAAGRLGRDGHPRLGEVMPPVPLPRRMFAGGGMHFHRPLRCGETVIQRRRISDVVAKQGRSGPLVLVTVTSEILTPDEILLLAETQTIVYRPDPDPIHPESVSPPNRPVRAPPSADWAIPWRPDPVLLFRFSALTFNGHRIHYDVEYAQQIEGYAGLVVHGPLLALAMLNAGIAHHWQRVESFSFRGQRPLILGDGFTACGRGTNLWAADDTGAVLMQGRIGLR